MEGARLEIEHLKEIKKEEEKDEEEKDDDDDEYGDKHKWEKKDYKILKIYNDQDLLKLKNKHIASLKKNLKTIPKSYKKKLIKISNNNPQLGKKIGFITLYHIKKKQLLTKKRRTQKEIKKLIEEIKNMNLIEYLKYLKKEENEEENEEEENEEETEDESIRNILELEEIQEKDKNIKYDLMF